MNYWLQQLQSYLQNLSKELCSIEDQEISNEGQIAIGELDQLTSDFLDQIRHEYETKKRKIIDRNIVDLGKCQTLIALLEKQKFHLDSLAVIFSWLFSYITELCPLKLCSFDWLIGPISVKSSNEPTKISILVSIGQFFKLG